MRRCIAGMAKLGQLQRALAEEIMDEFSDFFERVGREYTFLAGDLPFFEPGAKTSQIGDSEYAVAFVPTARFRALIAAIAKAGGYPVADMNGWPIIEAPVTAVSQGVDA